MLAASLSSSPPEPAAVLVSDARVQSRGQRREVVEEGLQDRHAGAGDRGVTRSVGRVHRAPLREGHRQEVAAEAVEGLLERRRFEHLGVDRIVLLAAAAGPAVLHDVDQAAVRLRPQPPVDEPGLVHGVGPSLGVRVPVVEGRAVAEEGQAGVEEGLVERVDVGVARQAAHVPEVPGDGVDGVAVRRDAVLHREPGAQVGHVVDRRYDRITDHGFLTRLAYNRPSSTSGERETERAR